MTTFLNPPSKYFHIISLLHYKMRITLTGIASTLLTLFQSLCQRTPLHIAVKHFQVRTVKFLVDVGADINSKDIHGVNETT